jgi:sugar transferase EpsL
MKYVIDWIIALVLLVLFFPVLCIISILVRIRLGKPVFFRQMRPGLHGKPFILLKFRTMTDAVDGAGELLPDAKRLTRFGRFLRSTSLDELPTLLNVLRGNMSLVGPRPLLMEYMDLYTPEQLHRHDVKPGITGWAQVHGRNALSWPEKFELDLWYVKNRTLLLDIKILCMTVIQVFKQSEVNQEGQATMEKFTGSN